MVGINHGPLHLGVVAKDAAKPLAVKDVVAQHQRHFVVADEFFAEDKGLGKAVGDFLLDIGEAATPLAAVAKQPLEARQVVWREMIRMSRMPLIVSVDSR